MLTLEFHFYEDYFNRLLKVQTGMTYIEYLQMLRLERAEMLLTETNNTIEQIAEEAGYHNKGYFYRIFIERNNCTPAQYRKKRQERLLYVPVSFYLIYYRNIQSRTSIPLRFISLWLLAI